jgi:APA family basic amino acid/polyamine antiporter
MQNWTEFHYKVCSLAKPVVFTREATGLVREYGLWMAFVVCMMTLNIGNNIPQLYFSGPALTPGADMGLAITLDLIPVFFWVVGTAMLVQMFPRSAGDYMFAARSSTGILGWFSAFTSFAILVPMSMGFNGAIFASFMLAQALATMGALGAGSAGLTAFATWLTTPWGIMIVGSIVQVLSVLVIAFGAKVFTYTTTFLIVVGLLGMAVMVAVIASVSHAQFVQMLDTAYGAGTYQNILNSASKTVGGPIFQFSFLASFLAMPVAITSYGGVNASIAIGGETKSAQNTIPLSIILTAVISWAFMAGLWYLLVNTFSVDFITGVGILAFKAPNLYPLPVPPTMNFFSALIANNLYIAALIGLSFVFWCFLVNIAAYVLLSRLFFAMSFDRLLPSFLADVNERLHTPVKACILALIVGEIGLYAVTFTSLVSLAAALGVVWGVSGVIAGIALLVFPLTRKALIEQAPSRWGIKRKLGPVPVMSIIGAGYAISMGLVAYAGVITDQAPGANTIMGVLLVVGLLLYGVVYWVRKQQGIDLSLIFKEIPPE